jgi:DNA polymerase-3 subunit delta
MAGTIHVFDFLEQDSPSIPLGMAVLFGGERFLQRLALSKLIKVVSGDEDSEFAATFFEPDNLAWADVHDELVTRSLFAGDSPRIVVIDHADKFVTEHRERLEDYLNPPKPKVRAKPKAGAKSKSKVEPLAESEEPVGGQASDPKNTKPDGSQSRQFIGLLVLLVDSWVSTTRLFKEVEKNGLQIKCDPPLLGRSKNRDEQKIGKWLISRAKTEYGFRLSTAGAQLVIDLADAEFGRMDQELQKLALYVSPSGDLSMDAIREAVGGWKTNTTWEAIDAATDGDSGKALVLLDRLLRGGEHPLALFGQISSTLRRFAVTTEIVFRQVRNGQRADVEAAMKMAGFPTWGDGLAANEQRLKRIGRNRAQQISKWLVEADLALKRSHSKEEMGRLVLENLLVRIANG